MDYQLGFRFYYRILIGYYRGYFTRFLTDNWFENHIKKK